MTSQHDLQKQTQQSSNSFSGRGDLKEIIATGNVKITGKNSDNQTFLAAGNTASYNAIAGEMILKGGRPILQQSANEYLQAAEDGQWIRLIMKDKDIESIITSQGKWVMQAVPQK
jgi:lipopolysaccharide export system protein LptA